MGEVTVPANLRAYVDALGVDGAVDFLLEFGGADLNISAKPNARNPVRERFGDDAAQAIAAVAHRLPREVPLGKPWIARVLHSKGLPKTAIARKLHVSQRTLTRYLDAVHDPNGRSDTDDPKQLRLF